MKQRRLVEVIVIDPDSNVPAEQALLLHTDPFLTDASDEAVFYEHGLNDLLEAHNKEVREELGLPPVTLDDIVFKVNTLTTVYTTD